MTPPPPTDPVPTVAAAPPAALEWHTLGNVRLSRVSLAQTLALVEAWAGRAPFRLIVTPNVDHIMALQRRADFRAAYARADLSLVDGRPVQWALRYLGLPRFEKVSGSDLTPALARRGAQLHWRIFFVGGRSDEDLRECLARIAGRFPGLEVGGACPAFGFESDPARSAALVEEIRAFAPDLLFFACGAPKSEIWMARHGDQLGRGVGIGCGASLRFLAGLERRAPGWLQRLGLEWAWRLAGEPRRLWRRYLIEDMPFFPLVWRWKREAARAARGPKRNSDEQ